MEKIRTVVDEKPLKEIFHNTFILSLIALIFSLVLASIYVTFSATGGDWADTMSVILIIFAGLLMFLSVFLFVTSKKAIKKATIFIREVEYDFLDDGLGFDVYRNNEKIENGKLPYQDFLDYRETKNYVFLRLANNSVFAIDKVDGLIEFLESKGINKFKSRNSKKK